MINHHDETDEMRMSWRHMVIYPAMVLHISGLAMVDYVVNEYTQSTIKDDLFPDATFDDNITNCHIANHSSQSYHDYTRVQTMTSHWIIYYALASRVPAILTNTFLTSYTDVYGRRFLFILSMFGAVIKMGFVSIIIIFRLPFVYIVVACGIEGIAGSPFSFISVILSFMADTSSTKKGMMFTVTIVEACFIVFLTLGGLLNGVIVGQFGYMASILTATALCFSGSTLVAALLPETLQERNRLKRSSFLKTCARAIEFYTSGDFKGQRISYMLLLAAFFFLELNANNRNSIETLYLLGMPFCWNPSEIGYFTSLRYAAQGVFGLGLLKSIQKCVSGDLIAILSSVANAATFVQEALAKTNVAMFLVSIPAIFSFLAVPLIRGLLSTMTAPDKQGSLFASVATVEVTSSLVATVSESAVYAATVAVSNSFVFYVMAGFCLISTGLLSMYSCTKNNKIAVNPEYDEINGVNSDRIPVNEE